MSRELWTKEQLKLAFHLYCQLPFGKLSKGTREVIELAQLIDRTPSAVALKLVNFASLDPAIRDSGRRGMGNASARDREVWDEFHVDWEALTLECVQLRASIGDAILESDTEPSLDQFQLDDYSGEVRSVLVKQRIKQDFFRRAVLTSYRNRCCLTGIAIPALLIASHIVPWSKDKSNRLNPSNGLCLSPLYDKAFDTGLITFDNDWRMQIAKHLRALKDAEVKKNFSALEGKKIEMPERFLPSPQFMAWHRTQKFWDRSSV